MTSLDAQSELVAALAPFGFSPYEAKAYIALLSGGPMNGHEVARAAGVPPPKVYETLERMTAKGAVLVQRGEPITYAAVPAAAYLDAARRRFEDQQARASDLLAALPARRDPGLIWSLREREAVLSAAREMIETAQRSLFAALWDRELAGLSPTLEAASRRGVAVHVAVYGHGALAGPQIYDLSLCGDSAVERLGGRRLSVLAGDGVHALVAEFRGEDEVEAVATDNPVMSLLAVEFVKSDVLGRLLIDVLGQARFDALRTPESRIEQLLRA